VTVLDVYVLFCFSFLGAITVVHAAVPRFYISLMDNSILTESPESFPDEQDIMDADLFNVMAFCCT
jgi:hypothetical protein